jgi:hypothetical protein
MQPSIGCLHWRGFGISVDGRVLVGRNRSIRDILRVIGIKVLIDV